MNKPLFTIFLTLTLIASGSAYAGAATELLQKYQQQGATDFSATRGEQLWQQQLTHTKSKGQARSCNSCHAESHKNAGKHIRTKKTIKAMAPSVNPERYTKEKKIRKWFKRNCKWTWGRECTAQEKGDLLTYLMQQ